MMMVATVATTGRERLHGKDSIEPGAVRGFDGAASSPSERVMHNHQVPLSSKSTPRLTITLT